MCALPGYPIFLFTRTIQFWMKVQRKKGHAIMATLLLFLRNQEKITCWLFMLDSVKFIPFSVHHVLLLLLFTAPCSAPIVFLFTLISPPFIIIFFDFIKRKSSFTWILGLLQRASIFQIIRKHSMSIWAGQIKNEKEQQREKMGADGGKEKWSYLAAIRIWLSFRYLPFYPNCPQPKKAGIEW